jgi:hypothetical protein
VVVAAFVQRLRGGDPAAPRIRKTRLPIWKIELPPGAEDTGDRGTIFKAGWTINYLFGHDGEKYIEFYATHRMTNDRRHRIYESGRVVDLDAIQEIYMYDSKIPGSEEEAKRRYMEHN